MDARRLSPDTQEDLRRRVVYAVLEDKKRPAEAARTFGVCRQSVASWVRAARVGGAKALAAQKRGPKPRHPDDERRIVRAICKGCPDQLLLPFALWTRDAVVAVIKKHARRKVSVWTAGRYLKRWGMTPQRPVRRAYERDEAAVKAWLEKEYPAIQARAKAEGALILWGDEMGVRSDDPVGRSYAPRGQTPVVKATGKRFGCSMISAISNLGQLWFMVYAKKLNGALFIRFLERLLKVTAMRRLFFIVDGHPAHKAKPVMRWLAEHAERMELFFLPGYSPDLNPDELVNQDTKQAMKKHRPRDQEELESKVRGHLRRRQKQPKVVRSFFEEEHVRYAAAE